jgi:hypothetical protein
MRVALLVSTFAFLAASPALAQCVYVACNGGGQAAPVYQQPAYQPQQAYMPAPGAARDNGSSYDEGYAAGLAARPAARRTNHAHRAAPARARATTTRTHTAHVAKRRATGTAVRTHAAPVAKRTVTRIARTTRPVVQHARAQAPRRVVATHSAPRRPAQSHNNYGYQDPIKDRAATYRPAVYGQSTSMASMMSRSGSYGSTTTTWSGPATLVRQGGQVCGWGAKIVTNSQGYAQRQAVWVCQCPQGWRPPGY